MDPKTGDWILPIGTNQIAKIIETITFGRVNHAAMVYDSVTVFETDGAWFKAKFNPLHDRFDTKEYYLIRPLFLRDPGLVQRLCHKYEGMPYSYWKIGLQAALAWLHPRIREKVVGWLSGRGVLLCSALTARIAFEESGYKALADYEGVTPQDLLELAFENPSDFLVEKKSVAKS